MSADIYTKSFSAPDVWGRALRLINVFRPHELDPKFLGAWITERLELGRSEAVTESREFIIAKNAQVRDTARDHGRMIPPAAKSRPAPSRRVGRKASRTPAAPACVVSSSSFPASFRQNASDLFLALPAVDFESSICCASHSEDFCFLDFSNSCCQTHSDSASSPAEDLSSVCSNSSVCCLDDSVTGRLSERIATCDVRQVYLPSS